jgi:hypothetical protein
MLHPAGDERTSVRAVLDALWSAPPSGSEYSSQSIDRHDAGQRFSKARSTERVERFRAVVPLYSARVLIIELYFIIR